MSDPTISSQSKLTIGLILGLVTVAGSFFAFVMSIAIGQANIRTDMANAARAMGDSVTAVRDEMRASIASVREDNLKSNGALQLQIAELRAQTLLLSERVVKPNEDRR